MSLQPGAAVTFAGATGPAGTTIPGNLGTVLFTDMVINQNNSFFNSGYGLSQGASSVISTLNYSLPNNFISTLSSGISPNWRVIIELNASMSTPFSLNNNIAYVGIGTSVPGTNGAGIYSGFFGGIRAPAIPNISCVADSQVLVAQTNLTGTSTTVKYIATYPSGTQVSFAVLASAYRVNTTFYVSGFMSLTRYPIYT